MSRPTVPWKAFATFFSFALSLLLVAAVTSLTAQPSPEVVEMRFNQATELRLQQIEGDRDFIFRVLEKHGLIEERK